MTASRTALLALAVFAALVVLSCNPGGPSPDAEAGLQIAVIPKGTTHEFWKAIHAGALTAARERGIGMVWKGPLKEDDREEQIQIVETFISAGVDAIVLSPLDNRALLRPVREAAGAGIPTVIFNSALEGDEHRAFVSTDNYRGGALAAGRVGELLGGAGRLVQVLYQEGVEGTTRREEGSGAAQGHPAEIRRVSGVLPDRLRGGVGRARTRRLAAGGGRAADG